MAKAWIILGLLGFLGCEGRGTYKGCKMRGNVKFRGSQVENSTYVHWGVGQHRLASVWYVISQFIMWNIWREWNNRIFEVEEHSMHCGILALCVCVCVCVFFFFFFFWSVNKNFIENKSKNKKISKLLGTLCVYWGPACFLLFNKYDLYLSKGKKKKYIYIYIASLY